MIRVYIEPDYSRTPAHVDNAGIRRVVEAQMEHLPLFGIEIVHEPNRAQVILNHGGSLIERPGVPTISINHGLYWSRQKWGASYLDVNRQVIESMLHAVEVTAPSEWVATSIRRGALIYPTVVYHGVDSDKFLPGKEHGNYVVWNKARPDVVSNPEDMQKVARLIPNRPFKTTIGTQYENVEVVGVLPHAQMKKLVSEAGVYLATVRETFGIATLEALAYGIPVAGFDWGGNSEIIVDGYTGYLAPPGDYKALAECVEHCFAERERLSSNCIEDARKRWRWEPRIEQYANIIKRVYAKYYERENKPKVSVIVTAYKLDRFLPACLDSISQQVYQDFECLVVDDAQLDSTRIIVEDFARRDPRIKYTPTPHNMKLSGARNFGFAQASGLYIRHMDADDILLPNALALESEALDRDPGIHIVYGHLEQIREDGTRMIDARGNPVRSEWPGIEFDWFQQMAHLNQLPSTVMARREVYERSGGYRERMKRAEDAEFWCRVTSLGFRARKITQAVTMFHRERSDSKGATEWAREGKEPDWTASFPWRMGASDYGEGHNIFRRYGHRHPRPHLVPFGAQGTPEGMPSWYVHDYSYPVVSVIITCGPSHRAYLLDALDSVQAQTYTDWEVIVVNDTGFDWGDKIMGAPYAKVINMGHNQGTSAARNAGYGMAKGKYIIWLDADDYWFPWTLEKMVAYAEKNSNTVIFGDLIKCEIVNEKEKFTIYRYPEFQCERVPLGMQYPGSSVLYPRKVVQSVFDSQGGYDLEIPGWEDKDFQIAVHVNGACACRVPEPLFVYRIYSTTKREKDYNNSQAITAYLDSKWAVYKTGEKKMGCGCGSQTKVPTSMPNSTMSSSGNFTAESLAQSGADQFNPNQMVEIEYIGELREPFSIRSRVRPDLHYRFANNEFHKIKPVFLLDAEFLIAQSDRDGNPIYRIVPSGETMENHDPTAFLGAPLEAS